MFFSLRAVLLLLAAWVVGGVARPSAQGPALPAFALTRLADGQAIASDALVRPDQWTVLIVRPACLPCRAVLQRFSNDAGLRLEPGQLVIVLSGLAPAEAAAVRASAPRLAGAAWYVDGSGAAADALDARSAPALFGFRRDRIAWSLRGSVFIDAQWQGVVNPWLQ
jgi:hypothetical protein